MSLPGPVLRDDKASRAHFWHLPLLVTFLKASAQPVVNEEESPMHILSTANTAFTIKTGGQGRQSGA